MALPLGADTSGHADLAAGLDGDSASLVRADAGGLDEGDDADAHVPTLGAQTRLFLFHELLVADHSRCLLQHRRVVPAVEDQRRKGLVNDLVVVGEGVGRYEVALANFDRVYAQLFSSDVQQPFHQVYPLRPASPAHGGGDHLVGEHDLEFTVVVVDIVGRHRVALGVEGDGQAVGVIRAGVVQEFVAHPQDAPVAGDCDLGVVDLTSFLGGGEEVLAPVFDPLDRPVQLDRPPGDKNFLGQEHHDLGAKGAAYERCDHSNLGLGQAQDLGQAVAHGDGRLGRVPHGQMLAFLIPVGNDTSVLHCPRRAPINDDAPLDDQVGPLSRRRVVALILNQVGSQVGIQVFVDERGVWLEGFLQVRRNFQRLVINHDVLQGVFGDVVAFGVDDSDCLANVAGFAFGQRHLGARVKNHSFDCVGGRHQRGAMLPEVAQVFGGVNGHHPRPAAGRGNVYALDASVGVVAAQKGRVEHAMYLHVVHVQSLPGQ